MYSKTSTISTRQCCNLVYFLVSKSYQSKWAFLPNREGWTCSIWLQSSAYLSGTIPTEQNSIYSWVYRKRTAREIIYFYFVVVAFWEMLTSTYFRIIMASSLSCLKKSYDLYDCTASRRYTPKLKTSKSTWRNSVGNIPEQTFHHWAKKRVACLTWHIWMTKNNV